MTDNNDDLIVRKFFEANRKDVPDDGFSQRVMRRLPDRMRLYSRLWTAVCTIIGIVVAVRFSWVDRIFWLCKEAFNAASGSKVLASYPLLPLFLLFFIIFIGGYRVMTEEN